MATDVIHDRGRGPEIAGTRWTVYNLLPYFLDATVTEEYIAAVSGLSMEQIAAARAYVMHNADSVLSEHLQIEERLAEGNPPELIEQAARTRAKLQRFREWLALREAAELEMSAEPHDEAEGTRDFPTFREWLAEQESRPAKRP
ncbi:MAG: hypothetical protein WD066_00995 [Planctomycetaceae bacterium]